MGWKNFLPTRICQFPLPEGFREKSRYSLASAGDLMAVDSMCYEYTEHLFDELKEFLFDADISCANLESTVNDNAPIGRNQSKFVPARMNTSREMFERFLDGGRGINFFATANNIPGITRKRAFAKRWKCWMPMGCTIPVPN